ncbi:hypothetical protein NIES2100_51220 [Calothrix sp. NIES-2100]|uniref:hypothetical protein n=1 Tax=Calothrix sp. NIES-2100 TaxID=1954172 RepID=UPI000B6013BA|nr:hypothetical protein NIES2100_51220 [Calothrix sp. NIES-2100]
MNNPWINSDRLQAVEKSSFIPGIHSLYLDFPGVSSMSQESEFPFVRARRVTPEENQIFTDAIADQFGITPRKRGRPTKDEEVC